MDTLEYRKLITVLDDQLDKAKREAEIKARRETLEQHLKLVNHQMEQLKSRKDQLDKLGVAPSLDLTAILEKLAGEKAGFERQLTEPAPAPIREKGIDQADRDEMSILIDEVEGTSPGPYSVEELGLMLECWALRWRMLAERVGQSWASSDRAFGKGYACIKTYMDQVPGAHDNSRINLALTRPKPGNAVAVVDWKSRFDAAQERLKELEEGRRKEQERAAAPEQALDDVMAAFVAYRDHDGAEEERALRHHIRTAAKFEHLRGEIALAVLPFRSILEPEFSFLWDSGKDEDVEEDPKKTLTNRDIAARIMRRMKSKTMIGGNHCPEDMVSRGFPPHDLGRSQEAIDLLVSAGIIRRKNNVGERRLSLEPPMMPQIDGFLSGKSMGIKTVDEWCGLA